MNILFNKNNNNEIEATIQKGVETISFSYIELIKSLLAKESLHCEFSDNIDKIEKEQINEVVNQIDQTVKNDILV